VSQQEARAAYEDLLRRYVPALRRLAWSYERDAAAREDLFQEIALALWTALPRFRGDSSERTWVYRVAHNTAITFVSQHRRRAQREHASDETPEPSAAAIQEADAIDRQRRERLWTAVQALPIVDRQLMVLHLEGLSAKDIEAVTGISAGAVATRLTRMRQKLTALLRDHADTSEESDR
jgi:RNA polymerase sigma-70 factor (ECF subfamily)